MTLGHLHGVVEAVFVAGTRAIARVMELVQIEIVSPEVLQRGVQVFPEILYGSSSRLGGNDNLLASVGEGGTDFLLAVGIEPRRVIEVDAVVVGLMQQIHGFFFTDSLDGQGTEAVLVHLQVGLP